MPKTRGKLIVIEGTDGTGKATQAKLLLERLLQAGYRAELIDFPQYNKKSAGLVEEYLEGKYGEANEVDPYVASMFYAVDRYDASQKMKRWLDSGKIIIANRYVTSSMAHQGGKLGIKLERQTFYDWLNNLEYQLFKIPKPDAIFVLHAPAELAQGLAQKRNTAEWHGKTNDIHEGNLDHLEHSERIYLEIAGLYNNIKIVNCTRDGELYSREFISDTIWQALRPALPDNIRLGQAPDFVALHDNGLSAQKTEKGLAQTMSISRLNKYAKLPKLNRSGSAYEIYCNDFYSVFPGETARISTGLSIALPGQYTGMVWGHDQAQILKFFDHSHTGELILIFNNSTQEIINYALGQKIAELFIQKTTRLIQKNL